MHILDVLKERGFIAQTTFEDELYEQLKQPTTFYVMVNMIIGSFNVFIQVMMLTGGDPNGKTSVLQYLLYDRAFNQFEFGEASAIGMISAVTIVILTVILNRTLKLNSTEQEG